MRTVPGRQGAPACTVALLGGLAVVLAFGCSSSHSGTGTNNGGGGGGGHGTPLSGPTAFQVHGQLALTPMGTATGAGLPAPPSSQDFLLYVDPGAPSVVSFRPDFVNRATAATDGVSFEAGPEFYVGLPGSCGGSEVDYSSFRFSVDGTTGTLAGTATGLASVIWGDIGFSYAAALTFTGTRDLTGPTFDLPATVDPFQPLELRASRPLPSSATAQLVAAGESIALSPLQSSAGLVLGFTFPAGLLPRYGAVYALLVTPWQDLAGNPGATLGQLATRAAPSSVAREDFEDPDAVSGDGVIVDDAVLPPISGKRSAVLLNDQYMAALEIESPHVSARLQVAPGDTVVRLTVRPFSYASSASTWGISMQAGVPGGAITTAILPPEETITLSSDPSSIGALGFGDVRTVEIPLPAGTASEVVVDLGAKTPSSCGLPAPPPAGYLIDDLRVE